MDQFPPPENKKLSTQKSEELSCVKKLKVFCGKNAYVRSILYMELGRVEEGDDLREGLLQVSEGCVCVYTIFILMTLTLLLKQSNKNNYVNTLMTQMNMKYF